MLLPVISPWHLSDDVYPMIACPFDATVSGWCQVTAVWSVLIHLLLWAIIYMPNPAVTQVPIQITQHGTGDSNRCLTADDGAVNSGCIMTSLYALIDDTPPVGRRRVTASRLMLIVAVWWVPVKAQFAELLITAVPILPWHRGDHYTAYGTQHDSEELVTLTADDGNGNSASCDFATLIDDTPPVIRLPGWCNALAGLKLCLVWWGHSPASSAIIAIPILLFTESWSSTPLMGPLSDSRGDHPDSRWWKR